MRPQSVLGLGAVAVDDLIFVDHHPKPDEKLRIQTLQRAAGGLAGTALAAVARLGVAATYYGVLGDDERSRFTLSAFERDNVDCRLVERRTGAGPYYSLIIVDTSTAKRSILTDASSVVTPTPSSFQESWLKNHGVLFVDHSVPELGLHAAQMARALEIPVVGDIEKIAPDSSIRTLVSAIDHLIVGMEMAHNLTTEKSPAAMATHLSQDRTCCVVTAGADGCWFAEAGGQAHHQPAIPVKAINTTGCGDVFHGGYAAELARGGSVRQAVQVATITAGLKAAHEGVREGIPDYSTVQHYLSRGL